MSSHEPFDDLEAELLALGSSLDVPSPPPDDVAAAVRARLETAPDQARDTRRLGTRRRWPRWRVVVAVVLAVVAVTAATPQGRAAVAHLLRYAGVELRVGRAPAPVRTPATVPGERAVAPDKLESLVNFPIRRPAALGAPRTVLVGDGGRVVSMLWPDGTRLDQFDGAPEPYFFKQLGVSPEPVRLGDTTAWWIGGEHPLGYIRRADGASVPLRQAGPTLLWQHGDVGHRLEGAGGKERAARIAASLR
ncbi:hypothetical protein FHU36_006937 [Nonomuraea muscovyensis]|uniref:DUF4367 domain-containing protein n=1 Tax=Nonomuraea muscovyensis TaxID=1124761 RepID=A0A7X0C881_9ACTN|nr:hypothetical protein [Nonomuraea muscovyensis]MBB6350365.1 hypothetical protein [Nonomuraea muscovyensis]